MIWFMARDGKRIGPYDDDTFRDMAARGEIGRDDLVWHSGAPAWIEARSIVGLLPEVPRQDTPPDQRLASVQRDEPSADSTAQATNARYRDPARTPDPAKIPDIKTSGNYFQRHWRGDLSLPVSYWVNGILTTLVVLLLTAAIANIDWTEHATAAALSVAAVYLLALVLTVWQVTGVWRSAEKHPSRGGSTGWATAAKAAVILGLIQTASQVGNQMIPQLGELWNIARGDPQWEEHTLRVLRDATELEISGPISFGMTADVAKTLDAHPSIRVVHLTSVGGRVEEAKKLARLFEARGLATHVSRSCESACGLAFMGGTQRTLARDAKLGFHSPNFPGLDTATRASMARDTIAFMVERGVPDAFAERAYGSGSSTMWYPTVEELQAAGIVTAVASPGDFAMSGVPPGELAEFEAGLLKVDLFAALKEHEPATYAVVLKEMREGFERGRTQAELRAEVMPLIQQVYAKRLPHGDDMITIEVSQMMLDQMNVMLERDPADCLANIRSEPSSGASVTKEMHERELVLMARLIRSAATGRHGPEPGPDFDRNMESIVMAMLETWGEDVLKLEHIGIRQPDDDPAKLCAMSIDMFERVLQLPPKQSASLLRTMYGS